MRRGKPRLRSFGLESGYHDLDKITSGWQNSDLVISTARLPWVKPLRAFDGKNMAVNFITPDSDILARNR